MNISRERVKMYLHNTKVILIALMVINTAFTVYAVGHAGRELLWTMTNVSKVDAEMKRVDEVVREWKSGVKSEEVTSVPLN